MSKRSAHVQCSTHKSEVPAGTAGDQRPPRAETDEKPFLGKYAQGRSGEGRKGVCCKENQIQAQGKELEADRYCLQLAAARICQACALQG